VKRVAVNRSEALGTCSGYTMKLLITTIQVKRAQQQINGGFSAVEVIVVVCVVVVVQVVFLPSVLSWVQLQTTLGYYYVFSSWYC
jgi:hypothetical protein